MDQKRMPPIPPASRSPKGPGSEPKVNDAKIDDPVSEDAKNTDEVGDRANVRQNTSNQQDNR